LPIRIDDKVYTPFFDIDSNYYIYDNIEILDKTDYYGVVEYPSAVTARKVILDKIQPTNPKEINIESSYLYKNLEFCGYSNFEYQKALRSFSPTYLVQGGFIAPKSNCYGAKLVYSPMVIFATIFIGTVYFGLLKRYGSHYSSILQYLQKSVKIFLLIIFFSFSILSILLAQHYFLLGTLSSIGFYALILVFILS
jgi:hypothetical protein